MKTKYKVGDKVKHVSRERYYQRGVVTEVGEGCNTLYTVAWEDGFYGPPDTGTFPHQDLTKINNYEK